MPSKVQIGENWYRVAEEDSGKLRYQEVSLPFFPPQVLQDEVSEGAWPPEGRVPYSFRDLSGGFGQDEVPLNGPNTKYDRVGDANGEGVDASLTPDGPIILGPKRNTQALSGIPDATENLRGVLRLGGSTKVYMAMGRAVLSWDGTTFTQVNGGSVLPVGSSPSDAIIAFRGTQSATYWYVPRGYSATVFYSTDTGATWTEITTGADFENVKSAIVIDGEVIFARASEFGQGNAQIARFNDGGTSPTSFGRIDPIGDPNFDITRLMSFHGRVVVLKEGEGMFVLASDRNTLAQQLLPELVNSGQLGFDPPTFLFGATVWRGILWVPTLAGVIAVSPDFAHEFAGPEQVMRGAAHTTSIRGHIQALAGDDYNLYGFMDSSGIGWMFKANVAISGGRIREIVWHPIMHGEGNMVMEHAAVVNPAGNGPRLLMDSQSGGSLRLWHFRLPRFGRDPRSDSAYEYADAGTLYFSRNTARFPGINKIFLGMTPLTSDLGRELDGLTATDKLSVQNRYKLDTTALTGTTPFGYTEGASQTTGVGARDSFNLRGRGLDTAIRMAQTDASDDQTPQLHAATLDYVLQPNDLSRFEMVLDLTQGSVSDEGASPGATPMTPAQAKIALRALRGGAQVVFTDPWGLRVNVTIPVDGVVIEPMPPQGGEPTEEVPFLAHVTIVEQSAAS